MPRGTAAQWLLARFTTRERAASIVGDLLESLPQTGPRRYWSAVGGILISLAWRRPIAFIGAFATFLVALNVLDEPLFQFSLHPAPEAWNRTFIWVGRIGIVLWTMMPYAAIRFGLRDRFTQLTVALVLALGTFVRFWWIPGAAVASATLAFTVIAASVAARSGRRALIAFASAMAATLCLGGLIFYLGARYQRYMHHGPSGQGDPRVDIPLLLACVFAVTWSCSLAHRLFIPSTSELESGD